MVKPSEIAVVTLYCGNAYDYGQRTASQKHRYCNRHGYLFKGFESVYSGLDKLPGPNWGKFAALEQAFWEHPLLKWAFWSDADAVINQTEVRLETFIDEDFDMLISNDIFGIHSGHFFIRNCKWANTFFTLLPTARLPEDLHTDQPSIKRLFHNYAGILDRVKNCGDQFNRFNSSPRGFTIHFADYPHRSRLKLISDFLERSGT